MKLNPGRVIAVLLVVTAGAAAQGPPDHPAMAFGNTSASYQAITGRERLNWAVKGTIGPVSLAAGLFSAGFGTAMNRPREYGPIGRVSANAMACGSPASLPAVP